MPGATGEVARCWSGFAGHRLEPASITNFRRFGTASRWTARNKIDVIVRKTAGGEVLAPPAESSGASLTSSLLFLFSLGFVHFCIAFVASNIFDKMRFFLYLSKCIRYVCSNN